MKKYSFTITECVYDEVIANSIEEAKNKIKIRLESGLYEFTPEAEISEGDIVEND